MNPLSRGSAFFASSLLAAATVVALCAARPVVAQSPASSESATAASDQELDTIVVTAQKRSEELQNVPISIAVVNADTLKQAYVEQLSDIAKVAPGIQFEGQGGFSQPIIRGVGTSVVSTGTGSNVGIYVDGFLLPNPLTTDLQFLNVSSVQVLKGPQGTLFGRNTTGGAILVTTSEPSTQPSVRAQVSYGSYNTQDYEAYATGGMGDKLAVDVAALDRRGNGWIRNVVTGQDAGNYNDWTVRTGVKFQVTDDFSLLLRYTHAAVNDASQAEHGILCCNGEGKAFSPAAYIPGGIVGTQPNEVSSALPIPFGSRSDAVQLTAIADFSFAKLTSYTQYRDEFAPQGVDLASSSVPITAVYFPYGDRIFTQELVLNSKPGGPLDWTSGLYYFSDVATSAASLSVGGAPYFWYISNHVWVQSLAAYADGTYQLATPLFLTAGLRVARDKYSDDFDQPQLPVPTVLNFDPITNTTATPRIALRYALNGSSNVYASFSRGYKSGLRNVASPAIGNQEVYPESLSAYEIGYKVAAPSISFNVAAFYYDYKNLQVSSYRLSTAVTNNAANSRIYGADADVRFAIGRHFEANASANYTDATYKSFLNDPVYRQCLSSSPPSCGPLGFVTATPTDLSDVPMQFAPKFSGAIGARYMRGLAGGQFTLGGNWGYVTKEYFDSAGLYSNSSHGDLTARAEWVDPSGHYTVAVFGDNLTNKRWLTQITPNTVGVVTSWNAPATVGGSLALKF